MDVRRTISEQTVNKTMIRTTLFTVNGTIPSSINPWPHKQGEGEKGKTDDNETELQEFNHRVSSDQNVWLHLDLLYQTNKENRYKRNSLGWVFMYVGIAYMYMHADESMYIHMQHICMYMHARESIYIHI